MSKRVVVELIDDLDGKPIEHGDGGTVQFAIEGRQYELDLSAANLVKLKEAVAPFVEVARTAKTTSPTATSPRRRKSTTELAEIREWARSQGIEVSGYGRVPAEVRSAFIAAKA
ncbi:Nucleoid-associated protein Lsr2 [Microbacterium oxydans]|uniref:Nucleoid-associated protein Lsr2 n=1 Tax=Microbacterium oxydans TaxID=82380 RepID=A0A0F0L7V6_9MICO|nr:Lsr2 family protein [Microbacterium oxydans]KJL29252.1 Nucleoid-associated protein Lsr2 [Microbacterium oxydans]CAH0198986.1 Nucleoid-associated protein Lsr2 [Microbacterium oxydans]